MRITLARLLERLATVASLANENGLAWRLADGTYKTAGALDIESSAYGYSVSITDEAGSSGVRLLSASGLTAAECWQFLDGLAVALDSVTRKPRAENESTESRELALYVENERAWWLPIQRTLSRKWKAGAFSLDAAIAYIDRAGCLPAARQYALEFGGMGDSAARLFPKAVRMAAAEQLARGLVAEFKLGNLCD